MNREQRIEDVLRKHPGVRDATAVCHTVDSIQALVLPNDTYIENGLKHTVSDAIAKWRKVFDLTQLTKDALSAPLGFNTLGWNSSYTRKPIPAEEMHEWLQTTVADILLLEPKSVYEVGCGTGMLLMAIAPHCDRYLGADFAPSVVAKLKEGLLKSSILRDRVEVIERPADNFDGLAHHSFDTVIINSVVQYFPGVSYLEGVLESAITLTKDGGRIFVGDILSLPLLPAFACSVAAFHLAEDVSVRELRDQIERRIQTEQQLILSPAYFEGLQTRFPRISHVETYPRRDRADNEMSRYRYHAILHLGHQKKPYPAGVFLDWTEERWKLNEIRPILRREPREWVGFRQIENPRLAKDLAMLAKVKTADAGQTIGQLRRDVAEVTRLGIHPQDLIDLGNDLDYKVLLSWKGSRSDGSYDAVFIPNKSFQLWSPATINWPTPSASDSSSVANTPGQGKFRNELIEHLLNYCRQNLPEDLVPSGIKLVDTLRDAAVDDGATEKF